MCILQTRVTKISCTALVYPGEIWERCDANF
jgi:hypothetical protein